MQHGLPAIYGRLYNEDFRTIYPKLAKGFGVPRLCVDREDVFFFKQKTAYEIMPSLVGSEMCIRDSYRPGGVMKDYFAENLQNSGWQEPVVSGELQNGKMYFIKFSSYIADSVGQKYDGQIYATLKNGNLIYPVSYTHLTLPTIYSA